MTFYSPIFLFICLPLCILFYFILPSKFKNATLFVFSLLFYVWGQYLTAIVLVLVFLINYVASVYIKHLPQVKKPVLIFTICLNIAILAFYKYLGTDLPTPIGISFITFMAISYIVDVYKGKAEYSDNPFKLAFYLSFFPKIISGPLDRYFDITSQLERKVNIVQIASGIKRFVIGLGKKVLIANTLGVTVDQIFTIPIGDLPTATAWLGIVCFTLQLFFDFSGYTDMAIGIGRIFGFELLENFNYPYISKSIREFWRRWHITLSNWLRDYLYIPLGGNRGTVLKTCLNLLVVFLICGMWHGSAWTFVVWGLWHGIFLVLERVIKIKVWQPLKHIYALLVIMTGWVFFRASSLTYAFCYLKSMFGLNQGNSAYEASIYIGLILAVALIVGVILSLPIGRYLSGFKTRYSAVYSVVTLLGLLGIFGLSILEIASGYYKPFLYGSF